MAGRRSFNRCCLCHGKISIDLLHLRMNKYLRLEKYQNEDFLHKIKINSAEDFSLSFKGEDEGGRWKVK